MRQADNLDRGFRVHRSERRRRPSTRNREAPILHPHVSTASRDPRHAIRPVFLLISIPLLTGCGGEAGASSGAWAGSVDTLPSGQVVVFNPDQPLWSEDEAWTVTEDLRIGVLDDPGPYEFAQINGLDVDALGRIWVLEGQAREIRVFDADGTHVRTVGGEGGGPGEFNQPAHAQFGPDGRLWVVDPSNNRISVVDTTGAFVESHRMEGGFVIFPWPGGFDVEGNYYLPIPRFDDGDFSVGLVRHGPGLTPLDTLERPSDPVERDAFELRDDEGRSRIVASVPFSPGFRITLSPQGTQWGLFTGEYRLFELSRGGDTLRTIRKAFDPLPVTSEDREEAREQLEWFTEQGGKIDLSRVPDTKPPAARFIVDDDGRVWVARTSDLPDGQLWDVFAPDGRFLGPVRLPVPMQTISRVRDGYIYGITRDELEVQYVVRARIEEGANGS